MEQLASQFQIIVTQVKHNIPFVLSILLVLWLINIINWMLKYRLNILGIYPRSFFGLFGIATSPFLHGNFSHFYFNALPLFVLVNLVLLSGRPAFYCASVVIIALGGLGVWIFGRRALHIGASTVIMGYLGYLIANAYFEHSALAITLGVITIYYLGGLLLNLFPDKVEVSWEGHVFGFIAGLAAAYLCPLIKIF